MLCSFLSSLLERYINYFWHRFPYLLLRYLVSDDSRDRMMMDIRVVHILFFTYSQEKDEEGGEGGVKGWLHMSPYLHNSQPANNSILDAFCFPPKKIKNKNKQKMYHHKQWHKFSRHICHVNQLKSRAQKKRLIDFPRVNLLDTQHTHTTLSSLTHSL